MRNPLAIGIVSVALLALAACSSVPQNSNADISAAVASASTATDHLRIADFYAAKATSYDAEAAFHERMSKSYFGRAKEDPSAWIAHCRSLKQKFTDAAEEARTLEQAHRKLADSLK